MKRVARREGKPSRRPPSWALVVLLIFAAGAVVAIAVVARGRMERRLAEEAVADVQHLAPSESEGNSAEEEPDPFLRKLLLAAEPADASVSALDAAAHALLVRERFEEADALVVRALAASPSDAEAIIHRAVLRGVAEDATASARTELEQLARGQAGWEASFFAAGFALRDGDTAAALRALKRFQAEAPPREVTPELLAEIAALEARDAGVRVRKKKR